MYLRSFSDLNLHRQWEQNTLKHRGRVLNIFKRLLSNAIWPHYCFTCSELEVVPSLCHVRPHFHISAILRREKIGLQQETHSAQAQKCRVGEGGLSDILGLDAVNVGGAETHVHTMQYIWNDSAFLWHKSWRGAAATNTSWQIFHWRLIWLMPSVLQLRAKILNTNILQCITGWFF